jgi:uncharacterized protein
MNIDWGELWVLAARRFTLGDHFMHGPDHWQRVERNALEIAPHTGAHILLVRLFAVLHDSNRRSDGHDPEHGVRAASWARELNGVRFQLDAARLDLLCDAMTRHDKGRVSDDPTIGTCWDADRLDLPRVGVRPAARLMSTARGKHLAAAPR